MSRIWEGGGGWSPGGVSVLWDTPLQFFSGAFSRNFKYSSGILSSSQVDSHPF